MNAVGGLFDGIYDPHIRYRFIVICSDFSGAFGI